MCSKQCLSTLSIANICTKNKMQTTFEMKTKHERTLTKAWHNESNKQKIENIFVG